MLKIIPSEELRTASKLSDLARILALVSFLFLIFYFSFILFAPSIHRFFRPVNKDLINPWFINWISETDGIELEAMFGSIAIYLVLSYLLIINFKSLKWLADGIIQTLLIAVAAVIFLMTNPKEIIGFIPVLGPNLLIVTFVLITLCLGYLWIRYVKISGWLDVFVPVFVLIIFGCFVILTFVPASCEDYNYFIGPSLKLTQGESLGSFYNQYNVFGLYLFKWMIDSGYKFHQMQLVIGLFFILSFYLYYLLAKKLLHEKHLVFQFMLSLVILRFLSLDHDPAFLPQASPIRLELWVPLLLITYKFGFLSPITAISFSVGYLMDDFFGFLYLLMYLLAIALNVIAQIIRKESLSFFKLLILAIPVVASLAIHMHYFGSLVSPGGKLYQGLRIGFLPISEHSLFWPIAFVLAFYIYFALKESDNHRLLVNIFMLAIAVCQLVYFFGRSHEHNLLNMSGIWLLILFFCFDRMIKLFSIKKVVFALAVGIIIFFSLFFGDQISYKFQTVSTHLSRGEFLEMHPLDKQIDQNLKIFSTVYQSNEKIFLMSNFDSYFNYRFGLKQVGFFCPFRSNVYVKDTIEFLRTLDENGYKIVFLERDINSLKLDALANNRYLKDQNLMFNPVNRGGFLELVLKQITN